MMTYISHKYDNVTRPILTKNQIKKSYLSFERWWNTESKVWLYFPLTVHFKKQNNNSK